MTNAPQPQAGSSHSMMRAIRKTLVLAAASVAAVSAHSTVIFDALTGGQGSYNQCFACTNNPTIQELGDIVTFAGTDRSLTTVTVGMTQQTFTGVTPYTVDVTMTLYNVNTGTLATTPIAARTQTLVCHGCWLVQTEDYTDADELFSAEYAYFSSTSSTWLAHARQYAQRMTEELRLTKDSLVIEVASNDGYLLKNFVGAGVPCLGIEPTASTAAAAEALGIPVQREFFGEAMARGLAAEGRQADLIAGNNVYAHVPHINDFTRGLKAALKPSGTLTLEFPHLMRLIEHTQFDTVYHEHFSYLSLTAVDSIFRAAGLRVRHVEQIPTHGGSLRVFGCHAADPQADTPDVAALLAEEERRGLRALDVYRGFQAHADRVKNDLVQFLIEQKRAGRSVAAYGAAAKGNTLLNYGGVKPDLLPFVCDGASAKQGKYMPGSHIPIRAPAALETNRPDFVLILPWNIADEVRSQLSFLSEGGTRFVTAVPSLRVSDD